MDIDGLIKFQKKFDLNENFMEIVFSLFERLVYFGYITKPKSKKLIKNLCENIDYLHIGTNNLYDYKTGFYDPINKTLYIKDAKDISSIYLRLLYAITTKEVSKNIYVNGLSLTKMRTDNYKFDYINFGINRAVYSNLVCKLCDRLPIELKISKSFKTYTHDFLGHEITSDNDIYSLEGKIFSEFCFSTGLSEELFFEAIFSNNSEKFLNRLFKKSKFESSDAFLKLFDKISIKYNQYNKLIYLEKKLNDNYLEIKKNILNNDIKNLQKENKEIKIQILNITNKLSENDSSNLTLDLGLSNSIESLEEELTKLINKIQDILTKNIISNFANISKILYVNKLLQFKNILINENKILFDKISETILFDIIPCCEIKVVNMTQKIRYSLVIDILSEEKFLNVSDNFKFSKIENISKDLSDEALIILNANNIFAKLVQIKGLSKKLNMNTIETNYLPLDNLKHLINSNYLISYPYDIENLYTEFISSNELFKNIKIEDIYIFNYNSKNYLLVYGKSQIYLAEIINNSSKFQFKFLEISDSFNIFKDNTKIRNKNSKLPMIVKN